MDKNEIEVLRRFIGWMMAPGSSPKVWERIEPETRFAMRSAYFLLNYDPGRDAESFITVTLERLLQRVSRVNEPLQVEYQGQVRGRIVWPATFKARYREDFDHSRFVCRQARRQYDTPENQLLKFVVERMGEGLRAIPEVIRHGFCYFPVSAAGLLPAAERIMRMESSLSNFRRHSRLRAVSLPAHITESHIRKAKMSPAEDYAEAADLFQSYARFYLQSDWRRHMARGARRVLPLPGALTAEGEMWVRLGAELMREGGF